MRFFFILLISALCAFAEEISGYVTVGILSHHFNKDENGNTFNNNHQAYGAEVSYDNRYSAAYLHLKNSRYKDTDIAAIGYRYDLYGPFGIYGVVGYQKGYCLEGFQSSVECTERKDNSGIAIMPMLYYRHDCFTLDLMAQGSMVALKLNLKLF